MRMGRPRTTNKDLPAGVRKIRGRYYYQGTKGTGRVSIPLGTDATEMRKKWVAIHFTPSPAVDIGIAGTLAELLDRYALEEIPRKQTETTRRQYTGYVAQLRAGFGHRRYARSEAEAATIPGVFRRMDVAALFRSTTKHVAANRRVSVLKDVFRCAADWGYTEYNPVAGVRRNTERPRTRLPTEAERIAIQEAASPIVLLILRFERITGWRKADVLRLHEKHLAVDGIELTQGKTGKKQIFSWTDELRAIIAEAKALRGKVRGLYIFCNRKGQAYTPDGFYSLWQRTLRKASITDLHFHDFRAEAISRAKDEGQNATDFAGHSDAAVTRRVYERLPVKVKTLK